MQDGHGFVRTITAGSGASGRGVLTWKIQLSFKKIYKPPVAVRGGGEKGRERGEKRRLCQQREREEEKREKEAAIKQNSTGVRLTGRCGHRENCGRKGAAKGGTTLFLSPLLPRRCAALPRPTHCITGCLKLVVNIPPKSSFFRRVFVMVHVAVLLFTHHPPPIIIISRSSHCLRAEGCKAGREGAMPCRLFIFSEILLHLSPITSRLLPHLSPSARLSVHPSLPSSFTPSPLLLPPSQLLPLIYSEAGCQRAAAAAIVCL